MIKRKVIVPVLSAAVVAGLAGCNGHTVPEKPAALDPYGIVTPEIWQKLEVPNRLLDTDPSWEQLDYVRRDGTVATAGEVADYFLRRVAPETAQELELSDRRRARIQKHGMTVKFLDARVSEMLRAYRERRHAVVESVIETTLRAQATTDDKERANLIRDARSDAKAESGPLLALDMQRIGWTLAAGEPGVTRATPATDDPWMKRDGKLDRLRPYIAPYERPFPDGEPSK